MESDEKGQVTGKLSPFLERYRNRRVAALIPDGSRVLDLGCGRGGLLRALYAAGKRGVSFVGVDTASPCIESAKAAYPGQEFSVMNLERDSLGSIDGAFDCVTLIAVIEHLDDPGRLLGEAAALLDEGGRVIITAPRRGAEKIYSIGGRLGLFSREAAEEHADFFPDRDFFDSLGASSGLRVDSYNFFLFGFNQLCILKTP